MIRASRRAPRSSQTRASSAPDQFVRFGTLAAVDTHHRHRPRPCARRGAGGRRTQGGTRMTRHAHERSATPPLFVTVTEPGA
ncbi:hypothetical protein HBB16_19260 [Pseudonocardia sp. MCCB 268]|nr:hypothetical protein [Pseudonocardia cytotoxica]